MVAVRFDRKTWTAVSFIIACCLASPAWIARDYISLSASIRAPLLYSLAGQNVSAFGNTSSSIIAPQPDIPISDSEINLVSPVKRDTSQKKPPHLQLPLPTPVLVLGLPKTGTKSLQFFFQKAGYQASHWECGRAGLCGFCIQKQIAMGNHPLANCGNYEVFTQLDVENPFGKCHFPQITDLDYLHQEAPNATFILTTRDLTHWAKSAINWVGGFNDTMATRLVECKDGPTAPTASALIEWHKAANQHVRDFVKSHPSHVLVELDIESQDTGSRLAHLFQTNPKFWPHAHDSSTSEGSLLSRNKTQ